MQRKSAIYSVIGLILITALVVLRLRVPAPEAHDGSPGSRESLPDSGVREAPVRRDNAAGSGLKPLLKPRLDETGKRHLAQDPGGILTQHASGDGDAWNRADDDLLAAWAALDIEAAMGWIDGGERAVVRSQLLGAVAAGILAGAGKDAMRRFLDAHQQDPQLRPKDQGRLEQSLFYHLGRKDTFDAAMELLRESNDTSLAGMMIAGIDGTQNQARAIDYMEAKGIPVVIDYWVLQEDINENPRFWADWARQRDSNLLDEILQSWYREHPDDAKEWKNYSGF